MTLGILRATNAVPALEKVLRENTGSVVRSQATIALGQIGLRDSLAAVQATQREDKSKDVQHQAELAAYAIEHGQTATPELAQAYAALDESKFGRVQVGQPASDFQLTDTEGKVWRLSDFRGKKPVVLIWVFADWCPVCHGEFRELIEPCLLVGTLRPAFEWSEVLESGQRCRKRKIARQNRSWRAAFGHSHKFRPMATCANRISMDRTTPAIRGCQRPSLHA